MDSTPGIITEKADKSYLYAAVESIAPLGNSLFTNSKPIALNEGSGLKNQHGGDRITQQWHGPSARKYPPDCPPLCPRWFYAVDVPKRKPKLLHSNMQFDSKPAPVPKKFATFSEHDSRSIEVAYQQLVEEYKEARNEASNVNTSQKTSTHSKMSKTSSNEAISDENRGGKFRVPVQEDFLFDVDVEKREISPVYWLGPVYEVRRGSWFYQEGTTLRPCEENLAAQLEEGYLKVKPFRYSKHSESITTNLRPLSWKPGDAPNSSTVNSSAQNRNSIETTEITPQAPENTKTVKNDTDENPIASSKEPSASVTHQPQTYRLFGTYMNTVVTYQDTCVAWLSADSIMSRVSSTVYQRFAGGGYLGGVKLVRGYTDANKTKEFPESKGSLAVSGSGTKNLGSNDHLLQNIDRQKSSKRQTGSSESLANQDGISQEEAESVRSPYQNESRCEYNDLENEAQGRQIDHLILCTHGIGQRLGMRTESVNFVHDINVLRRTLKSVYESSADLQALNSEIDKLPKNCRVQVLPICWRHLLDFPQKGVRQTRKEHDLGDVFGDEEEYPSLEDITVEGVPFVRSLITDLALDILLFQSAYREHICNIVLAESNRIYKLFMERNPEFRGQVSLLGHSLGSAILFDLLSRQKEQYFDQASRQKNQRNRPKSPSKTQSKDLEFEFEVEDFYCYGSPIGLFQMLKGRNISARQSGQNFIDGEITIDHEKLQDPFLASNQNSKLPSPQSISSDTGLPPTVSSPKVRRLYNIFHPSDPIAYRLEPLISPAMSSMKPQNLPYTKKTISSSMSGIGAKVGQSVSGIWTSLSSGLASSLFNRSLGLTNDDIARMEASGPSKHSSQSTGSNTTQDAALDASVLKRDEIFVKKKQLDEIAGNSDQEGMGGVNPATLISDDLETLYSGFQKTRRVDQNTGDEKWKRLKREEAKIRALNSNGRVDYSLQETFLDLNPMNTIASHMSYWADEDVSKN